LYEILGVEKTATLAEIKRAFRKKALLYHPDKNNDKLEWARQEFNKVSHAYHILADPKKREDYDANPFNYDNPDSWGSYFEEFFRSFKENFYGLEDEDEITWEELKEAYSEIKGFVEENVGYYYSRFRDWVFK
jgi:DnaJ-class molecular chaperone